MGVAGTGEIKNA